MHGMTYIQKIQRGGTVFRTDDQRRFAQIAASFGTMRDVALHKLFSMRSRGIAVGDEICRADFMKRCDIGLFF